MNTSEQIPPLAPPHPLIPPGFWEAHGTLVVLIGVIALAIVGFFVWLVLRPRPATPVPPAEQARQSLESLREQPEDGQILSRISQVLRRYIVEAFSLGSGEMTTSEIASGLGQNAVATPELADSVASFLRVCDERKFKANAASARLEAVPQALNLIQQAETRRAEVRRTTEAQAAQAKPAIG